MPKTSDTTPPKPPIAEPDKVQDPATPAAPTDGGGPTSLPPRGGSAGGGGGNTAPIPIDAELSSSYLDYAMSVIVSRALPDVCDGLKPVHRRILYAMHEAKCDYNKPYRKSARIVGDVMGKYHPHGDQSIYDALVRMAQDFSMRLPLLDGQGNFGSVDGDPPAAMRYTEIRLDKAAHAMLVDIESGTVDFQDNYDASVQEPKVLPTRLPNLLINGANGIAVGMATNIPPHNPNEVVDACLALLKSPQLSDKDLLARLPAPDFPTGGLIINKDKAAQAILSGRGSFMMQARHVLEETQKGRQFLIITEIPYQVNKASLIEKIADLIRNKQIDGISDLRDESNRRGMRIVIELKRDTNADILLNQLLVMTPLQSSFGVNMLALHNGRPMLMGLRKMLQAFLDFREQMVVRRAKFDLTKARARAHILVGLAIAVAHIDEVIALIRKSKTPADARAALLARSWPGKAVKGLIALIDDPRHTLGKDGKYQLSLEQATAILDLRLQRLTALGHDEINTEMKELEASIADLLEILRTRARVQQIVADELIEIRDSFDSPRRSQFADDTGTVHEEDLIPEEDMAVTLSHAGYIKRVALTNYRAQKRGGRGRTAVKPKDEDFVTHIYTANTHQPVMFFSSRGMVYRMKIWQLPLSNPQARGKALVNLLPLKPDETIATLTLLPKDEADWKGQYIIFATSNGSVRRNDIAAFSTINRNGKIAMKISQDNHLVGVALGSDHHDVLLTTQQGKAVRFPVKDLRVFSGRESTGVRGIRLAKDDKVISMAILRHTDTSVEEREAYLHQLRSKSSESQGSVLSKARRDQMKAAEEFILSVSANGFGKRSSAYEYRISSRGGKGIIAMKLNERTGPLVAAFPIKPSDEVMLITPEGIAIRSPVKDIRVAGRSTQGVRLMKLDSKTRVASVVRLTDDTSESE